ncbi:phospholipase [Salipiger sp. IMCC34102]|uniref:phospholipase D-like domain-containing protein n=1 Tax=Salipiger sp. IMCC34102 TaxID=2510647 RepID=UPI00101C1F4D|nr:phospholipase D-like domain-containing protein [Salipiger sp. IMCC34102]RYH02588.1 phospholipase [Salipiger sp. IMCC34102]
MTLDNTSTARDAPRKKAQAADEEDPLFQPGETCWRIARADRMSVIIDAETYFRMLRKIFILAEKELLLIGWDFDFEIEMLPGESDADGNAPDGYPNMLGAFIVKIVEEKPDLRAYLLKWNGAVLAAPGAVLPSLALDLFSGDHVHFALDGHHPFGACHHQKIVVADDTFAFCGGIDMTEDRWDTAKHKPGDPRRTRKDGTIAGPWHDATSALTGPVAAALGELSRMRWHRATGEELTPPKDTRRIEWPDTLDIGAENIDVAIARTEPPYNEEPLVDEIEQLYLRSIQAAEKSIYIESQYFAAENICEALNARLKEKNGPEIVVINPREAKSQLEDDAMHVLRGRMIDRLSASDHEDRFRIYYPANDADEPIYVHAKILIIDDRVLRLGSSNINNRSMGFDTECDVAVEERPGFIAGLRRQLLAEHLGISEEVFDATLAEEGSLIGVIERVNTSRGRGLRQIVRNAETGAGSFLADTRLLDPRYLPGQVAAAGRGLRPRHLVVGAGLAALAYLGWKAWSARK